MRAAGILLLSFATTAACGSDNERPGTDTDPNGAPIVPGDPSNPTDPSNPNNPVDPTDPNASGCAAANAEAGITLPPGFCATVFADGLGKARQIAVTPQGRVFVAVAESTKGAGDAHVAALYDGDGDGAAEQVSTLATIGGNGITWADGYLYVAANDRIVRYAMAEDALALSDAGTVIVRDLPIDGDHAAKSVVRIADKLYVNIGSPSNACQVENRVLHSPGKDPCDELATRAGIWQFDAAIPDQTQSCGHRFATGVRNGNALAVDGDVLWAASNGRDQLHENWPELFTEEQDKLLPSDEVIKVTSGVDRGWPYCYHDAVAGEMKLAPEYGGDGVAQGRCASIPSPAVALPAHAAVLSMVFASGTLLPEGYRSGAFVAQHGSRFDVNAPASELHGYDVEFIPFVDGAPSGAPVKFATGFDAGLRPLPDAAPHRPVGLAMLPDGSLLIGDDKGGRVWRVTYADPGT